MPRLLPSRGPAPAPADGFVVAPDPVPGRLPSPRTVACTLGALRTAAGSVLLTAPARSVRTLGVDSATAQRVTWLTRMTGTRDTVLGAALLGALARQRPGNPWLLAGAVSDAADAALLIGALRARRVGGPGAVGMVGAGALAAAVGVWAAIAAPRATG